MTHEIRLEKKKESVIKRVLSALLTLSMLVLTTIAAVFFSGNIGKYVSEGLSLALTRVIPTSLPFMIISDIVMHYANIDNIPYSDKFFPIMLGIPARGATPLIIGNICGFPLGGKLTSEAYQRGEIEKEDAERLLAYSSNPSAPFVSTVVGAGLLGDVRHGIMLLISLYIATLISIQFGRTKDVKSRETHFIVQQRYSFIDSVKRAGESCIAIISFITIFNCIVELIKQTITAPAFEALLISIIEVTTAVNYFSTNPSAPPIINICFIAFSLGFGGLSVMAQTSAFASSAGLSMRSYIKVKVLEGVLCAITASILYILFF